MEFHWLFIRMGSSLKVRSSEPSQSLGGFRIPSHHHTTANQMGRQVSGKNCQETIQTEYRPLHGSPGVSQHHSGRFRIQPSSMSAGEARSVFPVRDNQLHYAPQGQMWEKKVHRQQTNQSNLSAKGRDLLPSMRVGQPVVIRDVHDRMEKRTVPRATVRYALRGRSGCLCIAIGASKADQSCS